MMILHSELNRTLFLAKKWCCLSRNIAYASVAENHMYPKGKNQIGKLLAGPSEAGGLGAEAPQ